jgi:hypothetical protein
MDRAISAASDDGVAAAPCGLFGQRASAAGSGRLDCFGFNARSVEDGESFVDGDSAASGVLAGGGIVDQRNTTHGEIPLNNRASREDGYCLLFSHLGAGKMFWVGHDSSMPASGQVFRIIFSRNKCLLVQPAFPQGLKPSSFCGICGTTEVVP